MIHRLLQNWLLSKQKARALSLKLIELFDKKYYLEHNPDVAASGMDPLDHYLKYGWREERDPRQDFSAKYYCRKHGVRDQNPLIHWIQVGRGRGLSTREQSINLAELLGLKEKEIILIKSVFDATHYSKLYPDIVEAGVDPFQHYMIYGWKEGRIPCEGFSPSYYLMENQDISTANINPFLHYVLHGKKEGRYPRPIEDYRTAREFAIEVLELNSKDYDRLVLYFDSEFYSKNYREIKQDPLLHFLYIGWKEGRNPSSSFDTSYYVEANKDIAASGMNPFVHWVFNGQLEGRACKPSITKLISTAEIDWNKYSAKDVIDISDRFDDNYYLQKYPDVKSKNIDPKIHYLLLGWKMGYDPSPSFSTKYYLDRYPDIRKNNINPFLHYCQFGHIEQRETQSYIKLRHNSYEPLVSIIIPNYNHSSYLRQRIISVAQQTYQNIEIIILDDNSTDDSRQIISDTVDELGLQVKLLFNDVNSGNVFAQWQKGLENSSGDLIWICESDDFCDSKFLECLIPFFCDESVNIAFGRIQFADRFGRFMEGLDAYREGAESGVWENQVIRPAAEWFDAAFGVNNIIANVGGCIFRKIDLPGYIWDEVKTFKICGDWFLYVKIAGAGQIAFDPNAVAYFRQHGENTSASNFHQKYYYDENIRILNLIVDTWGISKATRTKFLAKIEAQYKHFGLIDRLGEFGSVYPIDRLVSQQRTKQHIQVFFLGFYSGGGELFPINLANSLLNEGYIVSLFALDLTNINEDMLARVDRRIPIYHASHMTSRGRREFFAACGVSAINSHIAAADAFLYTMGAHSIERPWVVTLHGSYVGFESAPEQMISWITQNVSTWIYTAEKNLDFFKVRSIDCKNFIKLPNAMPKDARPASFNRCDLGISSNDIVFTLVARGIKRKGWIAAIEGFRILHDQYHRKTTHLLLIGEGEATERAYAASQDISNIHFLGYQSTINGILRLSDCLILPSRFEGESYPLCLIQALQEGCAVIATDIGEVRSMMSGNTSEPCGILIENQRDSRQFYNDLANAMDLMCNSISRNYYSSLSNERAKQFDIDILAQRYSSIFNMTIAS